MRRVLVFFELFVASVARTVSSQASSWRGRKSFGVALFLGLLISSDANATAQMVEGSSVPVRFRTSQRSLITDSVDRSRTSPTPGAVHPVALSSRDLGPVQSSFLVEHLQINLRRPSERQTAFDAFVDALHQPNADVYHDWLTGEEIGAEFGPSDSDIATIRDYLASEGFTVNHVAKSGMFIDFSGTAEQVEQSFHTEIHNLTTPDGRQRYSAIKPARLPEALTQAVVGFIPISNIGAIPAFPHAVSQTLPSTAEPNYIGTCGNGSCSDVGPQDFYTIYNEKPIISAGTNNGAGVTIALLEQSDITVADVTTFRTMFNVLPNAPSLIVMNGSKSISCQDPMKTSGESEAVLDAEWAGVVAPAASLLLMSCPSAYISAEAVVEDDLAPIMSLSFIDSELNGYAAVYSVLWEQAAAQGQTVVVCAGDTGSASNVPGMHAIIATNGAVVNAYASSAYNVAAGGTDFQDTYNYLEGDSEYGPARYWSNSNASGGSSALSYVPETTWNDSCAGSLVADYDNGNTPLTPNSFCDANPAFGNMGGSGGVSMVNPRPSWQDGTVYGLPAASGGYNYRLVPDISFYASPGIWGHYLVYYDSDAAPALRNGGGTSFVAPQVAGIFALIAQKTGTRLGQPNYVLYSLAGVVYGTSSFLGSDCNGSGAITNTGTTSSSPGGNCVFYDVVTGNNSQECTAGTNNCYSDNGSVGILSSSTTAPRPAYSAALGYDLATGIGSANITNLINAWPNPAFSLSVNPSLTLPAGQSATTVIAVIPVNGFSSSVTLTCSGLPSYTSCSFSPASVTPSEMPVTSSLTIATTAPVVARSMPLGVFKQPLYALLFPGLVMAFKIGSRRIRIFRNHLLCAALLSMLAGCGDTLPPLYQGTPQGVYKVTIVASAVGNAALTQSATLTVTVTN